MSDENDKFKNIVLATVVSALFMLFMPHNNTMGSVLFVVSIYSIPEDTEYRDEYFAQDDEITG